MYSKISKSLQIYSVNHYNSYIRLEQTINIVKREILIHKKKYLLRSPFFKMIKYLNANILYYISK